MYSFLPVMLEQSFDPFGIFIILLSIEKRSLMALFSYLLSFELSFVSLDVNTMLFVFPDDDRRSRL
jgi:hypothetical protein